MLTAHEANINPMKRLFTGALWMFAVWYITATIAFFTGVTDLAGPVLGAAAGAFVVLDPARLIWANKAVVQRKALAQP